MQPVTSPASAVREWKRADDPSLRRNAAGGTDRGRGRTAERAGGFDIGGLQDLWSDVRGGRRARRPERRWYRQARGSGLALGALLALLPLGGCRGPDVAPRRDVPFDARDAFEHGLDLQARGQQDAALAALRKATALAPEFVDAHRAYQNLLMARHRRGQLVGEYRDLLEEAPRSAPRVYLYGRVLQDRSRQRAHFERAAALDPNLYLAHVGVGYVNLQDGDAAAARAAFERAVDLAPERAEGWAGLLDALVRSGDPAAASRRERAAERLLELDPSSAAALRVMLARSIEQDGAPAACAAAVDFALREQSPESFDLALQLLDAHGRQEDMEAARDRLAAPPAPPYESLERLRLCAELERRSGSPAGAFAVLDGASANFRRAESLGALRRDLLLELRYFGQYVDEVAARRLGSGFLLGDGGEAERRFARLRDLMGSRADGPVGAAAAESARLLLSLGLHEAAIALARAALEQAPGEREPEAVLRDALRHRRFVTELRRYFLDAYARPGEPASLEAVLDDLRDLSRECLGENVVDPVVTRDFFPIGSFLDPDPARGGGLARYFDRFGAFALIGQRTFGPCEAYVIRRVAQGRVDVAGQDVYRVLGEDLLVPPRAETRGAEIAGFAFSSFIVLNVDRARSFAAAARALHSHHAADPRSLLEDPLPPSRSALERVDVGEPLSLAARSLFRAYRDFVASGAPPEHFPGLVLDSFEAHERAHILDAARYLPLWSGLLEKLGVLASHGFSAESIEAWLEERAQLRALAEARSPQLVLAGTAQMLPNREDRPPHSRGFADLARRLVAAVADAPEDYPALAAAAPILPQLDRLDDATLRRLARTLLDEAGEPAAAGERLMPPP